MNPDEESNITDLKELKKRIKEELKKEILSELYKELKSEEKESAEKISSLPKDKIRTIETPLENRHRLKSQSNAKLLVKLYRFPLNLFLKLQVIQLSMPT